MGSDWTEPRHPAKKKARETIADRKEAVERRRKRRRRRGRKNETKRRRMEDHFEYIVEAVRIVPPEGTRGS